MYFILWSKQVQERELEIGAKDFILVWWRRRHRGVVLIKYEHNNLAERMNILLGKKNWKLF